MYPGSEQSASQTTHKEAESYACTTPELLRPDTSGARRVFARES